MEDQYTRETVEHFYALTQILMLVFLSHNAWNNESESESDANNREF